VTRPCSQAGLYGSLVPRPGFTAACKRPGRLGLAARVLPRAAPHVVRAAGGRDLVAELAASGAGRVVVTIIAGDWFRQAGLLAEAAGLKG
jgi:hypothetical protein